MIGLRLVHTGCGALRCDADDNITVITDKQMLTARISFELVTRPTNYLSPHMQI